MIDIRRTFYGDSYTPSQGIPAAAYQALSDQGFMFFFSFGGSILVQGNSFSEIVGCNSVDSLIQIAVETVTVN